MSAPATADAPAPAPPQAAASAADAVTTLVDPAADPLEGGRRLRIGVQRAAAPFAFEYTPGRGDFRGYSVELCLRIVELMRRDLGLDFRPGLDVQFVPVTSKTRFVQLLAGQIDLECGSTSNTSTRRALGIAFTPTIFVSDVGVLVAPQAAAHARSLDSLLQYLRKNRRAFVTTEGSTSVRHARALAELPGGPVALLLGSDHADSLRRLLAGDADAFVMDRALLAAQLRTHRRLSERGYVVPAWSPAPGQLECYGVMSRGINFASFGLRVKNKLEQMRAARELRALHERWFRLPLAGDNLLPRMAAGQSLDLPLRDDFELLLLDPSQRPCGETAL